MISNKNQTQKEIEITNSIFVCELGVYDFENETFLAFNEL